MLSKILDVFYDRGIIGNHRDGSPYLRRKRAEESRLRGELGVMIENIRKKRSLCNNKHAEVNK